VPRPDLRRPGARARVRTGPRDRSHGRVSDSRFGARLRAAMDKYGPLCVGIDPHPSLLAAWGLPDDPSGLARFTQTVVEAVADRVPVAKPQSAFFERFGSSGV